MYRCSALTVATAATAEHAIAALWNPHATGDIWIQEVHVWLTVGTASVPALRRISARGTPGSTVTPAREHDPAYGAAPPSGALVDCATYTVQPTLIGASSQSSSLFRAQLAALIGASFMYPIPATDQIRVPAGAGVVLVTSTAVAFPASIVTFVWRDI